MNQSLSIENQVVEPLQSLYLSPIQRAIVKYLSWTPSTMSALKKRFPERNAHILKKDIQYMMRVGMVERIGLNYSIVQPVEAQPVDNQTIVSLDRISTILKEYDNDDIDLPKEETVTLIKIVNGFEQDKATSYTLLTKNVKKEIQSIENQRDDNKDIYACWSAIRGNNDDTVIHLKKVNQEGAFCGFGRTILLRCGGEPVSMSDANLSYQKLCEECKKVALDNVQNSENETQSVGNQPDRMSTILKEYDNDDIDLPKEEMVVIELTELENKVLTCFIDLLEDYDWGFSDIICFNLVKPTHLTLNQIKGVIGSLTKKGLVYTDDMDTKHDLIHLNEKAYQLHKQWNDPTKGNLEIRIIPKGKTQDIESQAVSPLNASNEKQDMIRTALKNTLLNSGKPTNEISKKGEISKTEISSFKNGTRNISLDRCLELTCKLGLTTYFLNHLQRGINDRLSEINGTKFKTTKTQLNLF
jgi:hypothetical protein